MTLTRVIGKDRTALLERSELDALRSRYRDVIVDAGTGDARFAYHLASEHPDRLVLALDALDAPMEEIAHKAARKPARGGRPNLLCLRVAIESPPPELHAIASEVYVQLPWGRLLEGIVRAEPDVRDGIAALCEPGARLTITLNGEIWADSTPARYEDLPLANPEYVHDVIAPAFAKAGIVLEPARWLTAEEAKALPTTWARRLGHGRAHPRFVHVEGSSRSLH